MKPQMMVSSLNTPCYIFNVMNNIYIMVVVPWVILLCLLSHAIKSSNENMILNTNIQLKIMI